MEIEDSYAPPSQFSDFRRAPAAHRAAQRCAHEQLLSLLLSSPSMTVAVANRLEHAGTMS